ncbi:MAG: sterol desaturase family protein [Actinomycetota bacterium]
MARPRPRADELRTRRDTLSAFAASGSARVLAVLATAIVAVRLAVGGAGWPDLVVVLVTLVIAGPVEWVIHRMLLHAPEDAWSSRTLGTGSGHRRHHLDPPDLEWLLLPGRDAGIFVVGFAPVTAAWVVPSMWVLDGPLLGPFLTGWALAAIGVLHYEWVHLLVHTRYRPRSRYYARLARNHRLHHFRNERYWLGVTTNSGDRLLGTYPADRGAVPLSATARTLGASVDDG